MCKLTTAVSCTLAISLVVSSFAVRGADSATPSDTEIIASAMKAAPAKVGANATVIAMGADGKRKQAGATLVVPDSAAKK